MVADAEGEDNDQARICVGFRPIAPELLKKYIRQAKTGLPGMTYVQLSADVQWPEKLQVRLPQ